MCPVTKLARVHLHPTELNCACFGLPLLVKRQQPGIGPRLSLTAHSLALISSPLHKVADLAQDRIAGLNRPLEQVRGHFAPYFAILLNMGAPDNFCRRQGSGLGGEQVGNPIHCPRGFG